MSKSLTEFYGDIMPDVPGCPTPTINKAIINTIREFCSYTGVWRQRLTPISTVVIEEADDIAFVSGSPCTITSTSTSFTSAGLAADDEIITNHETSDADEKDNTGPYTLNTVAANTLTLVSTDSLSSETAGDETTISKCSYELSSSDGDIVKVAFAKFDGNAILPKTESWLNNNVPAWRTQMAQAPEWFTVDIENRFMRLVYAPNEAIDNVLEVWVSLMPSITATTFEDFLYNEYRETVAFGALARLQKGSKREWHDMSAASTNYQLFLNGRNKAWHDGNLGIAGANFELRA